MGRARFLLLVLLASVFGDLLYVLLDPSSRIPTVGASGGISGLVAFYGLRFPRVRLRVAKAFQFFDLRAKTAVWIWIALQVIGAVVQSAEGGGVNYLAHLGGAAVGLGFWALAR